MERRNFNAESLLGPGFVWDPNANSMDPNYLSRFKYLAGNMYDQVEWYYEWMPSTNTPGFDATMINTTFDLWPGDEWAKMNWYIHPIGDCRNNSIPELSQRKGWDGKAENPKYRGCIKMDVFYKNIAARLMDPPQAT